MKDFQIRVIARACITRYDLGEGDIKTIMGSYNLTTEDAVQVEAYIYSTRSDITPATA